MIKALDEINDYFTEEIKILRRDLSIITCAQILSLSDNFKLLPPPTPSYFCQSPTGFGALKKPRGSRLCQVPAGSQTGVKDSRFRKRG